MNKKLDFSSITKNFLGWVLIFFLLYPIFAVVGGIILAILHIIFGGNGDWGTALINTAGFAWKHWELTLLMLFIFALFSQSKFKEKLHPQYIKVKRRVLPAKLYVQETRKRTKKESPLELKEAKNKKNDKDIKQFFKFLENKGTELIGTYQVGIMLDDTNYNVFHSFINDVKESLLILCWRVDEKLLSEMLWPIRNRQIKVKVVTKNRTNKGYLNEFKNYCSNLNLELAHRNKIHAKIILKDNQIIALGSSNITNASMSKTGHFLDCNIITNHKETVEDASNLFESVYYNKDYMKKIENSKLMYSRNRQDCLPFSLKHYFERETEEIILMFSCNMVDKRIVDKIIKWNNKTPIQIYVGDSFKTSYLSIDNLNSMKWLYDTSINNYKNVKVIPIHKDIHAKLYLFRKQQIGFISSQNLTVESWQSLLEAGIISDEAKEFKYLYDSIKSLKKSVLSKIELGDLEKTTKPESLFSGSDSESTLQIPWELPEVNPSWKIERRRGQEYFNLIKRKVDRKNGESKDIYWKREETTKITKSPLLEELEKDYLSKQAVTGRYSRPTRFVVTGKPSKNRTKREWELEIKKLKKKLEVETSEQKKKQIVEGIRWCQKELDKFDEE